MSRPLRVIFACAGSAGHINPAIATADAFKMFSPEPEILFIGSDKRLEKELIPKAGYRLRNINAQGLIRSVKPDAIKNNVKAIKLILTATRRALEIIDEFNPDIVVGTGGYICYPVLKAAKKRKIMTAIHESNASPGLTTKLTSKIVDKLYVAFPESAQKYGAKVCVEVAPTPVRSSFKNISRDAARKQLGIADDEKLVVSFFGSLGAANLNDSIIDMIRRNASQKAFRHIHAVGGTEKRYAEFINGLPAADYIDVRRYIDNMPTVMAAADLVICRAGASTLAELALVGRASVLIPSPFVPNDHQTPNAKAMEAAGASLCLTEAECNGDRLYTVSGNLLSSGKIPHMEENAKKLGSPNAAGELAVKLFELVRDRIG